MLSPALFSKEPRIHDFATGDVVFAEGDPGRTMFVVLEGRISVEREGRILEEVAPGGIFGEIAILDEGPRSATARATEPSRLCEVDVHRFQFLTQNMPFFAIEVMRVMADRLRRKDVGRH
jgi:CRP/FNR family cyclic AMP-dependent transcriptional regulator